MFSLKRASGAASKSGTPFRHLTAALGVAFPVDEWLYGIARVRDGLRQMENTIILAEALQGEPPLLEAMQLPFRPDDFWLGLDFPESYDIDGSRLLYTAHFAAPAAPGGVQCGLLVDEWTEVIPGIRNEASTDVKNLHSQTTGVAFHFDRPNAEAPQSFLLVTPAAWDGKWHWSELVGALDWTWSMARKRAVEPQQIDGSAMGHFLPATMMAAAAREITISAVLAANVSVARFMRD